MEKSRWLAWKFEKEKESIKAVPSRIDTNSVVEYDEQNIPKGVRMGTFNLDKFESTKLILPGLSCEPSGVR